MWLIRKADEVKLTPKQQEIMSMIEKIEDTMGTQEPKAHDDKEKSLPFEEHLLEELKEILESVSKKGEKKDEKKEVKKEEKKEMPKPMFPEAK